MVLVICLIVFLVTYRRAEFRRAVPQHVGAIAGGHADSDRGRHDGAQLRAGRVRGRCVAAGGRVPVVVEDRCGAKCGSIRIRMKTPVLGEVWLKYQVAQFSRVLSTLLMGGIPLLQALDTAADSLGTQAA